MISKELIAKVRELAQAETAKYNAPAWEQIDFAARVAQRLAMQTGANSQIVEVGTYLMDF